MEITIRSRNMEVTDRLKEYVEKKTGRLDRYMSNLNEIRVDLAEENARNVSERHVAQITVWDKRGTMLRAEERSNDMFSAVDAVVDKLYRQINRYRGKRQRNRRQAAEEKLDYEPLPIEEGLEQMDEAQEIVRQKRFSLQPMSTEEAIDQMDLLGHDFFIFFNPEEDAVNVVYKRYDGTYGLLMPEM